MRPYFYRLLLIFLLVTPLMLKAQEKKYYDENEKSIDSAHAKYFATIRVLTPVIS